MLNAETSRSGNLGPVAELREDEDEAYFSSYGHYGIHEEMLKVRALQTHAGQAFCHFPLEQKWVHQQTPWLNDSGVACK